MNYAGAQAELTNWSKSANSPCIVYRATKATEVARVLDIARMQGLTVIPHGAGHSYTDAALNTNGIVIDVKPMRRILSWDPEHGIMRVEPGVTLREMVQMSWKDGWWPYVSPSTSEVTIGGCTAMNVNGRNAWRCGPFGAHVLSLDVMFASGDVCTLSPERDTQLFYAFVGSMGLLGIITSITVQLQQLSSSYVTVRRRSASSLAEILSMFTEEEPRSDFMEAWLDGFARGTQLGRGNITCATLNKNGHTDEPAFSPSGVLDRLGKPLVSFAASLGRSALLPGVQMANSLNDWWSRRNRQKQGRQRLLVPYTYWPMLANAGYHALFSAGVETFHAFIPEQHAEEIIERALRYSQQHECMPIWCIIKRHRRDPFLLSYQVDGFSLELNYQRTHKTAPRLKPVLEHMIGTVIEAGGRFYLAKDHFLTNAQFRQSVGDEAVDTFLKLKQTYDPDMLLQSDLFRRVFQPSR